MGLLGVGLVVFMGLNIRGKAYCKDDHTAQCVPRYWPKTLELPLSFCDKIHCECNELNPNWKDCPDGYFCADGRCWKKKN